MSVSLPNLPFLSGACSFVMQDVIDGTSFFHFAKAHFKGFFFIYKQDVEGRSLPNVVVPRVTAGKQGVI